METESGRRRSLRKREGKSYAEFGEADFIIDDDNSVPTSPLKGASSGGATSASSVIRHQANHNNSTPLSNGDIEMESEDDEDDGPLEPLPLPKVGPILIF